MTPFFHLATSVEAGSLRSAQSIHDLAYAQSLAAERQDVLTTAANYAPPLLVAYLGADKWVVIITSSGKWCSSFNEQFSIKQHPAFYHQEVLSPCVLYIRCKRSAQFINEEISLAFLPF